MWTISASEEIVAMPLPSKKIKQQTNKWLYCSFLLQNWLNCWHSQFVISLYLLFPPFVSFILYIFETKNLKDLLKTQNWFSCLLFSFFLCVLANNSLFHNSLCTSLSLLSLAFYYLNYWLYTRKVSLQLQQ